MAKFTPACKRIQGSLWRYIDRELTAPALAEISAHLKACGDCQRVFEARACDAKLYRMAFVESPFGEAFVERFRHRLDGEPAPVAGSGGAAAGDGVSPSSRFLSGVYSERDFSSDDVSGGRTSGLRRFFPRHLPGRGLANPQKILARVALAAALLTIGVSILYGLRPQASLGTFTIQGELTLERGGKPVPAPGRDLRPGDRFSLDGAGAELNITLGDGSELALAGPAEFMIDEASRLEGRFIASLEEGELHATVSHRGPGRELKILSPDAEARVVGTRFTLKVDPRRGTTLAVEEGEVRFKSSGGEVPVTLASGPYFAPKGRAPSSLTSSPSPVPSEVEDSPAPSDAAPEAAPDAPPPSPPAASPSPGANPDLDRPVEGKKSEEVPRQIREGVDLPVPPG